MASARKFDFLLETNTWPKGAVVYKKKQGRNYKQLKQQQSAYSWKHLKKEEMSLNLQKKNKTRNYQQTKITSSYHHVSYS